MRDFDPTAGEFISTGYLQHSRPGGRYHDPVTAMAGASVASGLIGADAAGNAADTQAQSAREANQLSRDQFNQIRSDLAPYRNLGSGASNMLASYLGLPGASTQPGSLSGQSLVDYSNGVPVANANLYASNEAYRNAWDQALADHQANYGTGYGVGSDGNEIEQWLRGTLAPEFTRQEQGPQDANFGSLLQNFTGEDLANEPGYKFGLDQGMEALDRRLAAGGNYFSGAALKGAQRFAQDYAGSKFTDAFNRDSANKTRAYNFLSGATSTGQNAAAQTGNAGSAMAQQVGANTMGAANASGAAQIAQGNAWSGGLNNIAGAYNQNELLNKVINGGNSGFAGWGSAGGWTGGGRVVPDYPGAGY